jgi:hypothetical protein
MNVHAYPEILIQTLSGVGRTTVIRLNEPAGGIRQHSWHELAQEVRGKNFVRISDGEIRFLDVMRQGIVEVSRLEPLSGGAANDNDFF